MKPTQRKIALKRLAYSATLAASALLFTPILSAKPVPANLGYGLDTLVESNIALKESPKAQRAAAQNGGYATEAAAINAQQAITAKDGRVMVDITLAGSVSFDQVKEALAGVDSFEVTATESKYKGVGIIEGYVAVDDVPAVAKVSGVRGVFLSRKPYLRSVRVAAPEGAAKGAKPAPAGPIATDALGQVGSKFDQGVTQHRVDKICRIYDPSAPVDYDGSGITVGVLSDSFNTRGSGSTAATAMASFDLPGASNNPYNTTPVVVLQDVVGTDEGRGMAEIVYKMAPRAKVGFATGDGGEVNFANNIRALSGKFPSVPNTRADFLADVITDDLGYGGEPVFTDTGVIANAVDDVAAVGVAYFSSASNSYGVTVYNSDLRMIPNGSGMTAATNTALVGTNVDLTGVPTNLYQGGFHNFNPNGGQDIACLWNVSNGAAVEMQWDDPYDTTDPVLNQPAIYSNTGTITATTTSVTFNDVPPFNAGTRYVIKETATSGNFDGIVSVIDPNGTTIVDQDTGTDETVTFFPPVSGQYSIAVRRFSTTTGNFTLTVNTANGSPLLSTDLNMLAFRVDTGAYVSGASLTSNNYANNRPVELGSIARPTGQTQLQFVIARSSAPIGPQPSTHVRLGTDANSDPNSAPAEYFDYNSTVTGGHNTAAGANGVAAYDVFRPNVPQNFTSAGPALIYFDRNDKRIPGGPILRLQPTVAAANNANTTWLTGDSANDFDTGGGQFGGTSASAPHAAGIAALVLQAHGGTGTVTPAQMTSILERSAFQHDLDPYLATGVARATNGAKVTVSVKSDQTAVQARGRNDPNSHTISLIGPSSITSFVFNPNGLASEGGGVTSGRNGLDTSNNYFSFVTPGLYFTNVTATGAFAFTFGSGSVGVASSDVSFALSNPAPAPANAVGQGQSLTLTIASGALTGGDVLRFTIGRALTRGPNVTNTNGSSLGNYNADNFGGGVLIPEGDVIPNGMRFSGTLADGSTFDGFMKNRIGNGYSNLDGYGFINAEKAVTTPIQ